MMRCRFAAHQSLQQTGRPLPVPRDIKVPPAGPLLNFIDRSRRATQVEKVLAELLERLAALEEAHDEVGDTEIRERLDDAVHHGFLIPTPGYRLPDGFAIYSPEGDQAVRDVLAWFLPTA